MENRERESGNMYIYMNSQHQVTTIWLEAIVVASASD